MKDENIRYKSGKNKGEIIDKYADVIKHLREEAAGKKSFKLHLKYWTGHTRPKLIDNECHYITVLVTYAIEFTSGNDAPRGGAAGDYIEVKVDRRNPFWKGVKK